MYFQFFFSRTTKIYPSQLQKETLPLCYLLALSGTEPQTTRSAPCTGSPNRDGVMTIAIHDTNRVERRLAILSS